jgi:hypothetical protein
MHALLRVAQADASPRCRRARYQQVSAPPPPCDASTWIAARDERHYSAPSEGWSALPSRPDVRQESPARTAKLESAPQPRTRCGDRRWRPSGPGRPASGARPEG